jgi:hypothetical protein
VPQAPTIGTATNASAGNVSVPFTAANNGGSAITGYTLTSSSGLTASGASSPLTLIETVSSVFTYTVTATNANGTSAASSASNSLTISLAPFAPTIGTATKGASTGTVSVTFTASGSGPVATSYTILSSGGQTATGASSPITVTGLTGGTSYTFQVRANNLVGNSSYSSASNSVAAPALQSQTFTSSGTWTNPGVSTVEVLVVAGGGGGNEMTANRGGGGGAGGLVYSASHSVSGNQNVTVGAGGNGWYQPFKSSSNNPAKGSDSVFGSITANGGGTGGGLSGSVSLKNGGCGGGGYSNGQTSNAPGTGNQGYGGGTAGGNGSSPSLACNTGGAGGGGAGGVGGNGGGIAVFMNGLWQVEPSSNSTGGSAGAGASYFGTTYAQGGAGGGANTGVVSLPTANRGIGGSSHNSAQENTTGGSSGIVIVRWLI